MDRRHRFIPRIILVMYAPLATWGLRLHKGSAGSVDAGTDTSTFQVPRAACTMDDIINMLAGVSDWKSEVGNGGNGVRSINFPKAFNAAFEFAKLGDHRSNMFLRTHNQWPNPRAEEWTGCRSRHLIQLESMMCSSQDGGRINADFKRLTTLQERMPNRTCEDARNYHGNGPEDARLLTIPAEDGSSSVLILHNDYTPSEPFQYEKVQVHSRRAQFARIVRAKRSAGQDGVEAVLGPEVALKVDDPTSMEKNWSPFVLDNDHDARPKTSAQTPAVYLHRFLEDKAGASIVLKVDLSTGNVLDEFRNPGNGAELHKTLRLETFLQHFRNPGNSVRLSGGTPAVRLNQTHFLAVGHTTRSISTRKDYRMFAYMFSSRPPFPIVASTPEFNIIPSSDIRNLTELKMRGLDEMERTLQFPVGLQLVDRQGGSPMVMLSWGYDDRDSHLSFMPVEVLLSKMESLHQATAD